VLAVTAGRLAFADPVEIDALVVNQPVAAVSLSRITNMNEAELRAGG